MIQLTLTLKMTFTVSKIVKWNIKYLKKKVSFCALVTFANENYDEENFCGKAQAKGYFFHGKLSRSTFPPHSITATFFRSCAGISWNFSVNTAATPTAAEGSINSFIRSQTSLIAEIISSSVTVMTSVKLSLMIGHVKWPTLVLNPSAIVSGGPVEDKVLYVSLPFKV